MGDLVGNLGSSLHATGGGIRDFLAGPGSGSQPIPAQILGSLLGVALLDQNPGLVLARNERLQHRVDQEQSGLERYLSTPEGQASLGAGSGAAIQSLFPMAHLPERTPMEAGPLPSGVPIVAAGPPGGPTTGAYVLPPTPETLGVARMKALADAQQSVFPIESYNPPAIQMQITDRGTTEVQSEVQPRKTHELLVPETQLDLDVLSQAGLLPVKTRFANPQGVPYFTLEVDPVAKAREIQAAKTAVGEASSMRRIAAQGAETRKNIDYKAGKPATPKLATPKPGDFERKLKATLLKKKLAGRPLSPDEQQLYDRWYGPRQMSDLAVMLGGPAVTPAAPPTSGTLPGGITYREGK